MSGFLQSIKAHPFNAALSALVVIFGAIGIVGMIFGG